MSDNQKPTTKKTTNKLVEKKPGLPFSLPKLTETQWAYVAMGIIAVCYGFYTFVIEPAANQVVVNDSINAPIQAANVETAEEKFKRENKQTVLPDGKGVPQHIIEENTRLIREVPFEDKELEFIVRLPNSWVTSTFARYGVPGQQDYSILTNISRFFGPAIEDARPYLWVEAERLRRYMTAETLARSYMIKRGISPEAIQIFSDTKVQALYVDVRDLRSYAVRSLFEIHGDTMVLASLGVPVESYNDYKDMMGLVLNSFRLNTPILRQIEEKKRIKLLNVLSFDHYASWQPKNEYVQSTLRPSIELHNPQEVNNPKGDLLQGMIILQAWRKSASNTPESMMQAVKDRLQEVSMLIKDTEKPTESLPLQKDFTDIKRTVYRAVVNTYVRRDEFDIVKSDLSKTQQEVWVTTLDNGYYTVYATMITPLQSTNYIIWAQNMAAYDLLLKTLTVRGTPKEE